MWCWRRSTRPFRTAAACSEPSAVGPAAGNRALSRQVHSRPQPAQRRLGQQHVAAVAADGVAGDRQAESRAAEILVARGIQPEERPEHVLARLGRDARTVVVDG